MSAPRYSVEFEATVWLWPGHKASWHFVNLPVEVGQQLHGVDELHNNLLSGKKRRGWGSIPVQAQIGVSVWNTSIFPDKKSGSYLLPIKAEVRKQEGVFAEQLVQVTLSMAMP